jgi:hypothetical protein
MGMRQTGTDKGESHETGEREPAKASKIDAGDRKDSLKGGVGMGKEDRPRNQSKVMESIHTNTGAMGDGKAYHHKREYGKERY